MIVVFMRFAFWPPLRNPAAPPPQVLKGSELFKAQRSKLKADRIRNWVLDLEVIKNGNYTSSCWIADNPDDHIQVNFNITEQKLNLDNYALALHGSELFFDWGGGFRKISLY